MVCVVSKNGHVLHTTERHGAVRRMLRDGKAKVVEKNPFTIQLTYTVPEDATCDATAQTEQAES